MYKTIKTPKTSLKVNKAYIGESIEEKVKRITTNKEPIKDGAPLIYTNRKDGVLPDYNIRTDRWEHAIDAMDKVTASYQAQREERHKTMGEEAKEGMKKEGGEATSIQGTINQ